VARGSRSVIPVGAYTEFFWTVNARALMNFVPLRAATPRRARSAAMPMRSSSFFATRACHARRFVAANRVAP